MNVRLIVALIAGILLAHALLIHLLLMTSSRHEPQKDAEQPRQSELFDPGPEEKTSAGPEPEESSVRPGIPALRSGAASEELKLDYSRAVHGVIPKLPGSKQVSGGILVDLNTGRVLWEKNSNVAYPIASMSKLMTMLLAYEKASDGTLPDGLDTRIPVTKEAAAVPASKVDLIVGETFPLRELLIAAAVKSANDAAWLIAQYIGNGKVDSFVKMMNERAKQLGMKNTTFFNPNGLPGKTKSQDNRSSPEDMVRLCRAFMKHAPLCEWTALRSASFRKPGDKHYMKLYNHNNLLPGAKYGTNGVTGLKTGFTNRAGFCVAASCTRDGRNLLVIVTGFPSAQDRDLFARALLDWGYRTK